jgi:hypothetical protein
MTQIPDVEAINSALRNSVDFNSLGSKDVTITAIRKAVMKAWKHFGIKVSLVYDKALDNSTEYMISGLFHLDADIRKPVEVILHYGKSKEVSLVSPGRFERLLFVLCQTVQHELIHREQNRKNGGKTSHIKFSDHDNMSNKKYDMALYFAETDEIDAHAHDIAMEIRYYYKNQNPKMILNTLEKRRKIPTYVFYKKAFRSANWTKVRKKLLKRAFLYLDNCALP